MTLYLGVFVSDPPSGPSLFSTGRKNTMGLEGNLSSGYSTVQDNTVQEKNSAGQPTAQQHSTEQLIAEQHTTYIKEQ